MTTSSEEGITFNTQRSFSNASTISPDMDEDEDLQDDLDVDEGPSFRLGSVSKVCVRGVLANQHSKRSPCFSP